VALAKANRLRIEPLPRGLLIVLGVAATTVAVAGIKSISGIVGPAFLALVLVIAVHPIRGWLVRRGMPSWVGTLASLLAVYAILVSLLVALVVSTARFAAILPQYQKQFQKLVDDTITWLDNLGVGKDQMNAVLKSLDVGKIADIATGVLGSALSVLSNLFFIVLLVLFLCADAAFFPIRLEEARGTRNQVVDALNSFAVGTRRYLVVSSVFGFIVAVFDTVALWIMGIPAPLLWGLLAFITNYIPNIGFIIGLVPPTVLALLVGGPGLAIAVVVVYCLLNLVIQTILQPRFVGESVGLSTTVTFLSLVFWAWVLGALGALLAIPLSLLAKALLVDVDPDASWLRPLISGGGPVKASRKTDEEPAEESSGDERREPEAVSSRADRDTT
jgi:predicted PurR-regulated permease PerM